MNVLDLLILIKIDTLINVSKIPLAGPFVFNDLICFYHNLDFRQV